ncbi:MAG: peptidoglycan DD-metalloendopeptidase family protein [Spirochaetaceae bacterium]|jgi:murein DD-endopeptidase MepM/ murein hydrolase activator NlpD|nr:peptidoglycan DD-metalloendopeptidase family protein [Spirochaetaceae bacterium]
MSFRPGFPHFRIGNTLKPFIKPCIVLLVCLAVLGLWLSAGFLFAGGRRDSGPANAAEEPALSADAPDAPEEPVLPAGPEQEAPPQDQERVLFRMAALPDSLRPGEPVTVGLALPPADTGAEGSPRIHAVLINAQGRRLSRAAFFTLPDGPAGRTVLAAVLAVPTTVHPGAAFIRTDPPIKGMEDLPLIITSRDFIFETIELNEENTELRTADEPQKILEAEHLWAILRRTGDTVYAGEAFEAPVRSTRRTSFFGDRRVYRYVNGATDAAIHAGIDYGVPQGTAVHACAPGKVVLARPRVVTGNSVVVEHLPGLYSLYYHLDTIAAAEGELVAKGALLGESGATGLATGPHLHWEIRAAGENADPDTFIERAILDKTTILSKLFN